MSHNYLKEDVDGSVSLSLPDIYIVKEGKIIGHSNDIVMVDKPVETMSKKVMKKLQDKYLDLLRDYKR